MGAGWPNGNDGTKKDRVAIKGETGTGSHNARGEGSEKGQENEASESPKPT